MQPNIVHELKSGLHRLIVDGVIGKWEPESLVTKLTIVRQNHKDEVFEETYYASADPQSGLPQVFTVKSVYAQVLNHPPENKNLSFKKLEDITGP